jgi:hypothetical protein
MVYVNRLETFQQEVAAQPAPLHANPRVDQINSQLTRIRGAVDQLHISIRETAQEIRATKVEMLQNMRDKPPTVCDRIGLFFINLFRSIGLIR